MQNIILSSSIYEKVKNKPALLDFDGNIMTYEMLWEFTYRMENVIAKNGSEKPLVMIICSNTIACISAYVAFIENGYTVMMLSENTDTVRMESLIISYQPEFIYIQKKHSMSKYIQGVSVYDFKDYVLYKTEYCHGLQIHPELALLLSTSGSTGSSKMVRISRENIRSNTEAIIHALNIEETDRAVTSLPCSYTYGLSVINTHLRVGATILVTDYKVADICFWEFVKKESCTSFSGVAYTYNMLLRLGSPWTKIHTLRKMTQAGEKMPLSVYEEILALAKKNNIRFQVMYGQTEATARICVMPLKYAEIKKGSVGKVIEGGKIRIRGADETGDGKIIYEGRNVAMGYAGNRDDLSNPDEWHNILDTGDYGYIDEDGFLYVSGRNDRYIKYTGNRINLDEMELCIEKTFECDAVIKYKNGIFNIKISADKENEIKEYIRESFKISFANINVKYSDEGFVSHNGKKMR